MRKAQSILALVALVIVVVGVYLTSSEKQSFEFNPPENRKVLLFKEEFQNSEFNDQEWLQNASKNLNLTIESHPFSALPVNQEDVASIIQSKAPGLCMLGVSAGFTSKNYSLSEIKDYVDSIIGTCKRKKLQTVVILDAKANVPDNLKLILQGSAKKHQAEFMDSFTF